MAKQSYLERLQAKIEEQIDVQIEAVAKALELDDPRPYGARKLTKQERIEYFASLPEEQQYAMWEQMEPDEQEEVRQGMIAMMQMQAGQGPV